MSILVASDLDPDPPNRPDPHTKKCLDPEHGYRECRVDAPQLLKGQSEIYTKCLQIIKSFFVSFCRPTYTFFMSRSL
jgi:hypothetical protein